MHTQTFRLLLMALLVFVLAGTTFAQQTTGTITGRVLDEQRAAVPGATVTAKNQATGFSRSEVSDSDSFPSVRLSPGFSVVLITSWPSISSA